MNPHSKEAHESSQAKFRNITGIRGGGHAHAGSSHMKSAGTDGTHKFWSGHKKAHDLEGKAHGGRSKHRADRRARGGGVSEQAVKHRTSYVQPNNVTRAAGEDSKFARGGHARKKGKSPENVTINIQSPPPAGAEAGKLPPMPPPGGAPPPGGPPPAPPPGPPGGAGGPNPMAQGLGKGMGFARGGRAGHRSTPKEKLEGDSKYDFKHWREHAAQNGRDKRDFLAPAHTQGADKVQARARGGRMTAGALSGVGRLEKAEISKRSKHR